MSILIMGMKKPEYCAQFNDGEYEYCPFVNTDDDCVLQQKSKGIQTWAEQYERCPLVELPPHGDLIDRDAVVKEMINGIRAGNLEEGYEMYPNINNLDDCVECVRYADAVIEAEGE